MQKIFNQRSFNYLVWTPLGSRVNLKIHFCLQVHFKVSAAWYCPIICQFATGITNTRETGDKICCWCRWYRRQIAAGVADNLPPVSLILVANLDLWISPRIFEKIWNGPNGILWGWGETYSWKTWSKKSRDTVPLMLLAPENQKLDLTCCVPRLSSVGSKQPSD